MKKYKTLKVFGDVEVGTIIDMDETDAKDLVVAGILEEVEVDEDIEGQVKAAVKGIGEGLADSVKTLVKNELDTAIKAIDKHGKINVSDVHDNIEDDPKGGYKDTNELFREIKRISEPGEVLDDRLKFMRHQSIKAPSGNSEVTGSAGEFLVAPEFSNRWLQREGVGLGIIAQTDSYTLTGNSLEVIGMIDHDRSSTTYRHGGVIAYWVGEGNQITSSQLKFRKVAFKLKKLGALAYVTDELMEDTANYGQKLDEKASAAIVDELEEKLFFGNGVGCPLGACAAPATVSVTKETSQATDTIMTENVSKMYQGLPSSSKGRANVYYNDECFVQLMALNMGGTTTTSGAFAHVPTFMPPGGISQAPYGSIFGRPAIPTDHCSALGDAGDIAMIDWSQYGFASKGTVQTAMSIHLRFDYAETAFRFTYRVDGRPLWDTVLTPRKGSIELSPFQMVADRA